MVEFIAFVRHRYRVDDLTVSRRAGFHVDYGERVGLGEVRTEQQSVRKIFRWRFHRQFRRGVEGRIWPDRHWNGSRCPTLSSCISPRAKEGEFRSAAYGLNRAWRARPTGNLERTSSLLLRFRTNEGRK